ncbi:flavodoxin family protein [Methanoculleus sp. FWC-SCC1]|uniref:Flavodoxin family protein n=1 Tax=Methanoculleus frigidifontis TaxID=2584085 RepID=A0ABT8M841_9EURY|nr:flavodoxin family protein [Methanoculleus sp. FWC-SCC1]
MPSAVLSSREKSRPEAAPYATARLLNFYAVQAESCVYPCRNKNDDMPAFRAMLAASKAVIVASPINWNGMSARLKVFLDRTHVHGEPLPPQQTRTDRGKGCRNSYLRPRRRCNQDRHGRLAELPAARLRTCPVRDRVSDARFAVQQQYRPGVLPERRADRPPYTGRCEQRHCVHAA